MVKSTCHVKYVTRSLPCRVNCVWFHKELAKMILAVHGYMVEDVEGWNRMHVRPWDLAEALADHDCS